MAPDIYRLPPDIDKRVKARIAGGSYTSEEQVLREAMNALDHLEREKLRRWQEQNRIAVEQSERGISKPLNLGAVLDRVERRIVGEEQGE